MALSYFFHSAYFSSLSYIHTCCTEAESKEKTWCMGPYAGVDYNLTLCPLQSDSHTCTMGNHLATLCQSRLYPPVRDLGFGLCTPGGGGGCEPSQNGKNKTNFEVYCPCCAHRPLMRKQILFSIAKIRGGPSLLYIPRKLYLRTDQREISLYTHIYAYARTFCACM